MIGQKAALMLANMILGTALGLVAAKVTAAYFGPVYAGQVSYALGLLGLLYFMTDLGMGPAHVKRVSEGRDPGDCFVTFATFKVVSTLLFVFAVTGMLIFYLVVLGKPLKSTTLPVILIAMGYYVAKSLAEIGQSSFDARLETAKSQLAQLADTLVRVVLTIALALVAAAVLHRSGPLLGRLPDNAFVQLIRDHPGAALASATAIGSLVAAVVSITLLLRIRERGRFRWELLKDYATFAFPLFLNSAIGIISVNIDTASLGFFMDDADVGIFGQVRRLPLVLGGIGIAVGALLFPAVSAMIARGDREGVQRTTDSAMRYLSMALVPTVAFVVVFPKPLISIALSDEFLAGSTALALLSVYVLLQTLGHTHAFLLLGFGKPKVAARVGIITAITLIVLNLVLVPADIKSLGLNLAGLGVTGAALATLISGVVWYVGLRISTARLAGYRESNRLWVHVLGSLVMVGVLLLLDRTLLPLTRWFDLPIYMVVGMLVYGLCLLALREIGPKDVAFVRATLHPGEMLRYIRGEIRQRKE